MKRWNAPPLWKLFTAGKAFETVVLGSKLTSTDLFVGLWGREEPFIGSPRKPQVDLKGRDTDETAFDAFRMLNVPMDELDWSERPIAVMHRPVRALAQSKPRLILFEYKCGDLLRLRCLLPFWLEPPLPDCGSEQSKERVTYYTAPKSFELAAKIRELRLAMSQLAH